MKGFLFIIFALFIDGLQAAVAWGLATIAAFPGTATGCAVGAAAAGKVGCLVLGLLGSLPIINGTLATVTIPIGIMLGLAISFCISATFGVALITLLAMDGMFYPKYILGGSVTELVPGINSIPAWSAMTVLCLLKKKKAEGTHRAGLFGGAALVGAAAKTLLSPTSALGTVARNIKNVGDTAPKNIDGVRPNNNGAQKVAATTLALLLVFAAGTTHAQSASSQPDPVQYIIAPEAPGPNSPVSIEVQGVGSFLGNAQVTWEQNGAVVLQGTGKATYSFTTGGVGTKTTVRLTINSAVQGTIVRTFVFYPSLVNLIWEADTSVPPLYLGKPLYSGGSRVAVTAFPTVMSGGALVASSKLSYQWFRSDALNQGASGLGKDTFTFVGDQLQQAENVRVEVYLGATHLASGEVDIPASNPQVVLYNRDPLRGELLDRALQGEVRLANKEVTLQAEPYFFANSSKKNGALTYAWTLNGNPAAGPESGQGILTLRQTGTGAGAAAVSVAVQNNDTDKFVQAANTALQMTFGAQTGNFISSFFGL